MRTDCRSGFFSMLTNKPEVVFHTSFGDDFAGGGVAKVAFGMVWLGSESRSGAA